MDTFTAIIWASGLLIGLGCVLFGVAVSFWYWTR